MSTQAKPMISVDRSTGRDLLKRSGFARHLLSVLKSVDAKRGAVIGLEGPWGTGKTSVIDLMRSIAEEEPDGLQFIQFSPWMVSGTNDMVRALLTEILSHCVPKDDRKWWRSFRAKPKGDAVEVFGDQLLNFVNVLAYIKYAAPLAEMIKPGGSLVVGGIAAAAEETGKVAEGLPGKVAQLFRNKKFPSLTEVKGQVVQAACELPHRMVVVIDDLDRLPPGEIGTIIQAVKAVADFPNVLYLLCYDRTTLASGVEAALQVSDGFAYLEKIVQIPLPLPEVPGSRFTAYAVDRLGTCLRAFDVPSVEAPRLDAALTIAASLMSNPREVERLRTRLTVVLPYSIGEINTADLIALEAIAQTHPLAIAEIRGEPSKYMNPGMYGNVPTISDRGLLGDRYSEFIEGFEINKEENQDRFEYPSHAFASKFARSQKELAPLINAIEFIFPRLALGHQRAHKNLPVARFRYWYAWLCLHDHQDPWSHSQFRALVTLPLSAIASGITQDADLFRNFCALVCDIKDESTVPANHVDAASFFIDASLNLPRDVFVDWGQGYGPLSALQKMLQPFDPEQRRQAVQKTIEEADIWLMGAFLRTIYKELVIAQRNESRLGDDAVFADLSIVKTLIELWLEKAEEDLLSGALAPTFNTSDLDSPHRLIRLMSDLDLPRDKVSSLTRRYASDPKHTQVFFGSLLTSPFVREYETVFDDSVLLQSDQFEPLIESLHLQGLCSPEFVKRFKCDVAAKRDRVPKGSH